MTDELDLSQAFPSGNSSGSLCLTIATLNDSAIEDPERLVVRVESEDEAVLIDESDAVITILDESTGTWE